MNDSVGDLSSVLGNHLHQFDLQPLEPFSFTDWVWRAIEGDLDITFAGISEGILRIFFDELWVNGALIRQLLLIAVLSALIRCLSDSFKNKSVSELSFYVSYILIIATVFASFRMSTGILMDMVRQATGMMEASVPLMISLMAMSGNVTGATVLHPMLFLGLTLMTRFIAYVYIPLVTGAAALHIVNLLAEGDVLGKYVSLAKEGADILLKFLVFLFLSLLALQKVSAPIIDNLVLRTAKSVAGAVPVVGGALNSAMNTVIYLSSAARSGVLVALVIVICIAVAVPLLKLLVFMFVYKITSAVVQPIADDRIVKCLDGLGDFTGMLLGAGVLVAVMFIFTCVLMLTL
ncbi:MAG: stage III sporulation protein AE [Defluviitaleaceae bacterium]|nr:stage III sporulation protein AE [Defluviitaleaceae bacterium]